MSERIDIPQRIPDPENAEATITNPEWLTLRREHIGSSELWALLPVEQQTAFLGKPWYFSQYALWALKMGHWDGPAENPAMREGSLIEDLVRLYVERETGLEFEPVVFRTEDFGMPLISSLDGWDSGVVLEIKRNDEQTHRQIISGTMLPVKHTPQCTAQMFASNAERHLYASVYRASTNDRYQIALLWTPREDFEMDDWRGTFDPLAGELSTAIALGDQWGNAEDERAIVLVIDDETFAATAAKLRNMEEQRRIVTARMNAAGIGDRDYDALKDALKAYAKNIPGDAPLAGAGVQISRYPIRESYRKATEGMRFSFPGLPTHKELTA